MTPSDVVKYAEKHGAKMIDCKFIDLPGIWQHITYPINRLNEELKQLKETSESYQERKLEISRKMAELQTLSKQWRDDLDKQYDNYTSQLLEEIDREIQAYGQREGYSLIFKKERPQPDTPRNVQVQLRGVLYHAPALEITDKIIELVNTKYEAEQKK